MVRFFLCISAIVSGLAGCATYNGVTEFSTYRTQYTAVADVGGDVLDRVAVAERRLYNRAYPLDDPAKLEFDPEFATYFVTSVDPPIVSSYRRTLNAVSAYNDALYALSSGEEAAAMAGKITRLSAIGASAAADAALLAGVGAASPLSGLVANARTINTALSGLEGLTATLLAFETRRQFRTQLIEKEPTIREAIGEVRASTRQLFQLLRDDVVTGALADPSRLSRTLTAAEVDQITRSRALLASLVVLLDSSEAALGIAVAAIEQNGGQGSFDGVILASGQLATAIRDARLKLANGN